MPRKVRLQEMLVITSLITQCGIGFIFFKKKKKIILYPTGACQMLQYFTVFITGNSILNTYVNL